MRGAEICMGYRGWVFNLGEMRRWRWTAHPPAASRRRRRMRGVEWRLLLDLGHVVSPLEEETPIFREGVKCCPGWKSVSDVRYTSMAYLPPHKRHSKDAEKPSPTPALFIPKFEKNLNLGHWNNFQGRKDQNASQSGKIIYGRNCISRWWAVGLQDDGRFPLSVRLEPFSCEPVEKKWGEKPLVLSHEVSSEDVNTDLQRSQKPPWMYITEKLQLDLVHCFENVRNEIEIEKFEVKPSFAARFGKILFDGSTSSTVDTIWKKLTAETASRNQVKKLFYTNVPSAYMETVRSLVVPKVGLDFESEKEHYHVKVYDKSRPDATISCKCSIERGGIELQKVELNQVRHLVADISCLDNDLDLRLMVTTKMILTVLTDEEEKSIRELIKSAIIDPDVKGGLRWPLGKECIGDRFRVIGGWHTKYQAFKNSVMTLKLRDADRFDFGTSMGEVTREVALKMTGISKQLKDGTVDPDTVKDVLQEKLQMIWENFLACNCSST